MKFLEKRSVAIIITIVVIIATVIISGSGDLKEFRNNALKTIVTENTIDDLEEAVGQAKNLLNKTSSDGLKKVVSKMQDILDKDNYEGDESKFTLREIEELFELNDQLKREFALACNDKSNKNSIYVKFRGAEDRMEDYIYAYNLEANKYNERLKTFPASIIKNFGHCYELPNFDGSMKDLQ